MSEAHHSPSPSPSPTSKHHQRRDHGEHHKPTLQPRHRHPARLVLISLLILLFLAGVIALVVYLVYRPSHPRFSVTSAAVFNLHSTNSAAAPTVSALMQFTLLIRNPNDRSSVVYERLAAFATYHGQPITPPAPLPPLFQERNSEASVSPVLGGAPVPVSGDVATALATEQAYGVVALRLVLLGRVRFKSGPFHSGWHSMYARCDVLAGLKNGTNGSQVPLLGKPECHVEI